MKILFFDLLYSSKGSFDDDFKSISSAIDGYCCEYVAIDINEKRWFRKVVSAIKKSRPQKVVFLSAKVYQLALLVPFLNGIKSYVIYHFMPRKRVRLHNFMIPLLGNFFKFGVYSSGVGKKISPLLKQDIPVLPPRIIDRSKAAALLERKLRGTSVYAFIPGVRTGIRDWIEPAQLILDARQVDIEIEKVFIQADTQGLETSGGCVERLALGLDDAAYAKFFQQSLIVAINFTPEYEVRSSAVVSDAIKYGCLVVAREHPILEQYGYPFGLVSNFEHISKLLGNLKVGYPVSQFYSDYPDFDEVQRKWVDYLK